MEGSQLEREQETVQGRQGETRTGWNSLDGGSHSDLQYANSVKTKVRLEVRLKTRIQRIAVYVYFKYQVSCNPHFFCILR